MEGMPLEPQPPPSPLGKASKRPRHHCDPLIPCALHLSDIGKSYHAFPKGTFCARYTPPTIPHSVLHYYMANPFSWSWTTKAGPKAGQTFSVPTIPISCKKDDHKAIHWTVSLFHSFKTHLGFTTGIPLGTGDRPISVLATGLYPHHGYGFGHGYQVWYPYLYPRRVYLWGTSREGGPR